MREGFLRTTVEQYAALQQAERVNPDASMVRRGA